MDHTKGEAFRLFRACHSIKHNARTCVDEQAGMDGLGIATLNAGKRLCWELYSWLNQVNSSMFATASPGARENRRAIASAGWGLRDNASRSSAGSG